MVLTTKKLHLVKKSMSIRSSIKWIKKYVISKLLTYKVRCTINRFKYLNCNLRTEIYRILILLPILRKVKMYCRSNSWGWRSWVNTRWLLNWLLKWKDMIVRLMKVLNLNTNCLSCKISKSCCSLSTTI